MKQYAIAGLVGVFFLSSCSSSDTNTIESIRTSYQEAQAIENTAIKLREGAEDLLSEAIYEECFSSAKTLSGVRFSDKQRQSYDCWKEQTKDLSISGTLATGSTVVPGGEIEPDKNSLSEATEPQLSETKKEILQDSESQYWEAYKVAVGQIHKWEGLRLSAYPDYKGYSIGYGTRASSSTEIITVEEADRRLIVIVKQLLEKVQKDFPNLHPEGQGALVSFAYNCHAGYQSVRENGLAYHSQWCKTAGGKILPGLVARRAEEEKLLFSNVPQVYSIADLEAQNFK